MKLTVDLKKYRGTLNEESIQIFDAIFSSNLRKGHVDASDFRADHVRWIDRIDQLQMEGYIARSTLNHYRVTFFGLLLLSANKDASRILDICKHIFEILRACYLDKKTRNSQKIFGDLAVEIGVTFDDIVTSIQYMDDISNFWRGGRSIDYGSPADAWVIPGEAILRLECFDDLLKCAERQIVAYVPFNLPNSGAVVEEGLPLPLPEPAAGPFQTLAPDAVIVSFLDKESSDDLVSSVNRAGLDVDWQLTEKQDYSSKMRNRVYIPKIQASLRALSSESRIMASAILAAELLRINPNVEPSLSTALNGIGWGIEDGKLFALDEPSAQAFFKKGTFHDAYEELRRILQTAKTKIFIVDPYVDATLFVMLKALSPGILQVRVLTSMAQGDFALELAKFTSQYTQFKLEVKTTKEFHDRFVVIDSKRIFHIGASIKDAGAKAFMLSEVDARTLVDAVKTYIDDSWKKATIYS